jgi:hypothetical protein
MARRDQIVEIADLARARRLILCVIVPLSLVAVGLVIYAVWLGA